MLDKVMRFSRRWRGGVIGIEAVAEFEAKAIPSWVGGSTSTTTHSIFNDIVLLCETCCAFHSNCIDAVFPFLGINWAHPEKTSRSCPYLRESFHP